MSPAASSRHQRICAELGLEIGLFLRTHRLGDLFSTPIHVVLDEHVHYEPDLCFVANERRAIIGENYISGPPDLIIEVISESNRSHDTVVKFNDCQRYGVKEYWLADPRENHIRVFTLEGSIYQILGIYAPGDRVQSRAFVGLDLTQLPFSRNSQSPRRRRKRAKEERKIPPPPPAVALSAASPRIEGREENHAGTNGPMREVRQTDAGARRASVRQRTRPAHL